jgi:hypothetical protein
MSMTHPEGCACPMCERRGCTRPAAGFLALRVRCPSRLLDDGEQPGAELATIPTGPQLCDEHFAEASRDAAPKIAEITRALDEAAGSQQYAGAIEAVLLPLDHPDVAMVCGRGRAA